MENEERKGQVFEDRAEESVRQMVSALGWSPGFLNIVLFLLAVNVSKNLHQILD